MKLMMMFLLLHTAIIILAIPAGSNTARRASTAGSSVIMTQGTYPDSSSIGSSRNFISLASDTPESGSTASVLATVAGSVASMMTAPTVTGPLLIGPSTATNDPEIPNTCILRTFNIDETSLKVYMVGVILAASFAGMTLIIVSLLTCSVGRNSHSSCALGTPVCRRILCTHRVKA
ncbi:uncharacterized protein F5147DRAFT_672894 [Suillus discolor]|uniref:Uncharacterized protein n=1 Tax=Suillus discolor TaxID=1912936 RepID=A0A9P7FHQ8_9AGAM|nr:uncharacterized protein F5147DRAFT_672894 [Suillus discolor]KAG2116450.1 hypothetical protein F5147DRAFT_672894 [Suillus discolor]